MKKLKKISLLKRLSAITGVLALFGAFGLCLFSIFSQDQNKVQSVSASNSQTILMNNNFVKGDTIHYDLQRDDISYSLSSYPSGSGFTPLVSAGRITYYSGYVYTISLQVSDFAKASTQHFGLSSNFTEGIVAINGLTPTSYSGVSFYAFTGYSATFRVIDHDITFSQSYSVIVSTYDCSTSYTSSDYLSGVSSLSGVYSDNYDFLLYVDRTWIMNHIDFEYVLSKRYNLSCYYNSILYNQVFLYLYNDGVQKLSFGFCNSGESDMNIVYMISNNRYVSNYTIEVVGGAESSNSDLLVVFNNLFDYIGLNTYDVGEITSAQYQSIIDNLQATIDEQSATIFDLTTQVQNLESSSASSYSNGYNQGYTDGFNEVQNEIATAYSDGYTDGFNEGYSSDSTATTILSGILQIALVPVNFFLGIFNFEILGINLSGFIRALFTIAITIIIIKTIFGGKGASE